MPLGTIYTESQAKKHLLESNRDYNNRLTWQNAIAGVNAQAAQAQSQLNQQYINASTDAYVQYLQNKNALQGSDVVGVGREQLLQQTELALRDAYNSYAQSLQEGRIDIQDNQLNALSNIESELELQAKNTAAYTNAHISYLQKLWEDYQNGENTLFNDPNWSKYLRYTKPLLNKKGEQMRDNEGNLLYDTTQPSLLDDAELTAMLFDEKGLTYQGADFFDQLENEIAQYDTGLSWSDYLKETDPELFEWAQTYNPYNYTAEGTNAGTLRTMYGMASDDYTYQFAERLAGITEEELTAVYDEVFKNLDLSEIVFEGDELSKYLLGVDENGIVNTKNMKSLKSMINKIGLDYDSDEQLKQLVDNTIVEIYNDSKKINQEYQKQIDILEKRNRSGMISGTITEDEKDRNKDEIARLKKQRDQELQSTENKIINRLLNYQMNSRRESEIEFNRRTGRI